MKAILYSICAVLEAITLVARGAAAMALWNWFAVPVFSAVTLGFPAAGGLTLLAGALTHQTGKFEMHDDPVIATMEAVGKAGMELYMLGVYCAVGYLLRGIL